ncbi:MAG: S-layer homology domain-containing protein [Clostridia bacterium]|nr:S-layer homology domain-containing protein [Clostridia bacterium]
MKKKLISMLLVMAMLVPMMAAMMPAKAAAPARTPIRSPQWHVAAMVIDIVEQTGAKNYTSDRDRIQAVYDWIIKNCKRSGSADKYYVDLDDLEARADEIIEMLQSDLDNGRAAMRDDLNYPLHGDYTTNYYLDHFGGEMAVFRVGNCLHYACLLTLCLGELGYTSYVIPGELISGGQELEHKWNMLILDGKPYYLDIRTDHASYESRGKISHKYFMVESFNEFSKNHKEWNSMLKQFLINEYNYGRHPYYYNGMDYSSLPNDKWEKNSPWADKYLYQALEEELIPKVMQYKDFTQNITREEFAALAVTLYEKQSGKTAEVAPVNPFNDTTSEDVLKAYNLGIVKGVALDHFAPTAPLTREQAATMLGRVHELIKKGKVGDGSGLDTSGATAFTDDNLIGGYAVPYVYFMNANKILEGVGNGSFNPLGNTTRESAVKIAVTMWTNLK